MTETTEMKVKTARWSDAKCECWSHCGQILVGAEVEVAALMERWWMVLAYTNEHLVLSHFFGLTKLV